MNYLVDVALYLTAAAIITIILGLFNQKVFVRIRPRVQAARIRARTRCPGNVATKLKLLRLLLLLR